MTAEQTRKTPERPPNDPKRPPNNPEYWIEKTCVRMFCGSKTVCFGGTMIFWTSQ